MLFSGRSGPSAAEADALAAAPATPASADGSFGAVDGAGAAAGANAVTSVAVAISGACIVRKNRSNGKRRVVVLAFVKIVLSDAEVRDRLRRNGKICCSGFKVVISFRV